MLRLTIDGLPWRWFLNLRIGREDEPDEKPDEGGIGAGSGNPIHGSGYGFRGAEAREHDPIRVYT